VQLVDVSLEKDHDPLMAEHERHRGRGSSWMAMTAGFETAVPRQISGFSYLNYQPLTPDCYLDRTAQWIRRMNSK
jgi:hypothetical protein